MKSRGFILTLLTLLVSIGCEGPAGSQGPAGLQGDTGAVGAAGPGTRIVLSGTLDANGAITVDLPAAAGSVDNPPLVACYVSQDGSEWFVVGSAPNVMLLQCLLSSGQTGNVRVEIRTSEPSTYANWHYKIVAVY